MTGDEMIRDEPYGSFKLANFRDVDGSGKAAAYTDFLNRFAADRREMIDVGLDLLALRPGSSVLDVGCGPGAIIPLLASRVETNGRVVGIDPSRELVAEARRRFIGSGLPVEISVGNAQTLDFADATFDAARTDRVLVYVSDLRQAVLELARVTKSGGHVVVTEPDMGASMVDSPDAETTRAVLAGVCDEFPNAWAGRRLRALFLDAGLIDAEVRAFSIMHTQFAQWSERMGIDEVLEKITGSGRISAATAKAWLDGLRKRDAAGRFFAANTLIMVSGTKAG
ncbi:MAG: methyltransferase domain-containing protein [Burkholderiales bacterium]